MNVFFTIEDGNLFSQAVASLSKRVILESKPHPVASDASDASLVVIFDAHWNFSDYKSIINQKAVCMLCNNYVQGIIQGWEIGDIPPRDEAVIVCNSTIYM